MVGNYYRDFKIRLLALSTTEVSRLARYIWVVASLSWPIPSEITERGIPFALAAEAQLCRATYRVSGMVTPTISAIRFRLWLML